MTPPHFSKFSILYFVGIVCALLTFLFINEPLIAQWFWLGGIFSVVAGLIIQEKLLTKKRKIIDLKNLFIIFFIFIISLLPRIIALTFSPPFVVGDEAACGLYGRMFLSGQAPLLSLGWYNLPMLSYVISGVGLKVFGDTIIGLRLTNAVLGSFCVVLIYLLAKELFSHKTGLLAAFLLSFSFLYLDLSRIGIHYIQAPTFLILTVYLYLKAQKSKNPLLAFFAGVSLAVDLQVYFSARIAFVLILLLFSLILFYYRKMLNDHFRIIGYLIFGLFIAGFPLLALFFAHPGSFSTRQNEVYIFNGSVDMRNHLRSAYNTADDLKTILIQQTIKTVVTFFYEGDSGLGIGWTKAIIDPITSTLFIFAFTYALFNILKKWQYMFCVVWILLVIGAGVVTVDPPAWPRLAVIFPPIMILIASFLENILNKFAPYKIKRILVTFIIYFLLISISIYNLYITFVEYPRTTKQSPPMLATLIGYFLANNPKAQNTILISGGELSLDYNTIRFLAPTSFGCTTTDDINICPNAKTARLFIILPSRSSELSYLKKSFPGGKVVNIGPKDFQNRAIAYERD